MATLSRDGTRPTSGRAAEADLVVSVTGTDPADLTVAVTGLPRIYCFGLLGALSASGIRGTAPRSVQEWTSLLAGGGPVVVVVAQDQAEGAREQLAAAGGTGTSAGPVSVPVPVPVSVVHVLPDLSPERCAQAFGDGATGVLLLDADLAEVASVVRAAAAGEVLLPRAVAASLCGPTGGSVPELGAQELQWLRSLADAWTVASLARRSGCSEREMYRLLNGLYARLGATNRTEALLRAQRTGLLDDLSS